MSSSLKFKNQPSWLQDISTKIKFSSRLPWGCKVVGLEPNRDNFKTAKISFHKMSHSKKRPYLEEKLDQNSQKPKELWKTLKSVSFGLTKGNASTVSVNKDGTIQFKPRDNVDIYEKVNYYYADQRVLC